MYLINLRNLINLINLINLDHLINLSIYLLIHTSLRPSIPSSLRPSIHPSIYRSIHPSIYWSIESILNICIYIYITSMSNSWIIWGALYELQTGIDPRAILRPRQRKIASKSTFNVATTSTSNVWKVEKARNLKKQQLLKTVSFKKKTDNWQNHTHHSLIYFNPPFFSPHSFSMTSLKLSEFDVFWKIRPFKPISCFLPWYKVKASSCSSSPSTKKNNENLNQKPLFGCPRKLVEG